MNRRDFLRHAAAAMAAAAGGCITAEGTRKEAGTTRGVVVSARDLSGAFDWPRLAHEAGLTTVATHIGPRDVMPFMTSGRGARFLDACAHYGIEATPARITGFRWSTSSTPSTGSFPARCSPPIRPSSA